ncbi:hypothetical protein [Haloprofundus sp. MHR1]|uniref:DUF7344 domain-containing protein n=1 Tax=Haloprofundus sp. MHR1 TaxID=2572921 RepID=UPI0020C585B9|nr:hypothetical protein [Haloprofundus sp. MHR1]
MDSGESTTDEEGPSEDELFDVLSNRRRRYALHALLNEGTCELGDLAELVAAWENGVSVEDVSSTERKRVYTALQQSHLPRMDECGVLTFDKRSGSVSPSPSLDEFEVYMDVVRGNDIPWSEYYLGLAGVSVVVLSAAWVDVYPLSAVSDLSWFAFVVAAFSASALTHVYFTRRMKLGTRETPPGAGP